MSSCDGNNSWIAKLTRGRFYPMTRFTGALSVFCMVLLLISAEAFATSTQFGDSGLISQPVAQTLHEGNICVGIWANCSDGLDTGTSSSGSSVIVPAVVTMGLGTFIEAYGSYPDLIFTGEEDRSGRGYANAGFKVRFKGKRSDPFRLAFDIQGRHSLSDNVDFDGLTDVVGRLIGSYNLETFGLHANVGYAKNESPDSIDYDDQIVFGAGVEYYLASRLRLIAEYSQETEKIPGLGGPSEAMLGLQYFITPHLTMNAGAAVGFSDASPGWRVILGLTTCQGVGTFNRPVPKLISPAEDLADEPATPAKPSKIQILTPLMSESSPAVSPVSHLEVPLDDADKDIIIDPVDRLKTPQLGNIVASPVGPIVTQKQADASTLPEQPFVTQVKRKFRFPELTFAFNQWDLSSVGMESISLVAEELRKENKYFIVSIEGHTDDVGSESYNQTLSFKRAIAVATHMVLKDGFDPARLFVKGFGESRPIADNADDEGRARNRRVELLILVPEGYENVDVITPPRNAGDNKSAHLNRPLIDPLSIEQAIMEKTGAETARPAGAFSQIEGVEQ